MPGKIIAAKYARENKIPFLGICLGLQCAIMEIARNVVGLEGAASTELDPDTPHTVIDLMEEQKKITKKGGTMRLGAYPCNLVKGTKAQKTYNKEHISERHRHRYEFNNKYLDDFEKAGVVFSGINPDSNLGEMMELKNHPWFIASQFHPEYESTVLNPHPLFVNFVAASLEHKKKKLENSNK